MDVYSIITLIFFGLFLTSALITLHPIGVFLKFFGNELNLKFVKYLRTITRYQILIVLFTLCFLPVAGQIIFMAGSVEILLLYITHSAMFVDVLLVSATALASTKLRSLIPVWHLFRSSFRHQSEKKADLRSSDSAPETEMSSKKLCRLNEDREL